MQRTLVIVIAALAAALTPAAGASTDAARAGATLQLQATFPTAWQFGPFCPPGTAPGIECVRFVGTASIPGLGTATSTYVKTFEPVCTLEAPVTQFRTASIEVAGKGTIHLLQPLTLCGPPAPAEVGPLDLFVTGGSGAYAGATGKFRFLSTVHEAGSRRCNGFACGFATDSWTGTLSAAGVDFDLAPPEIRGAVAKTVRVKGRARRARLRYAVTAQDSVDGPVAVACKPRSGAPFKIGRTTVTCSATDSSANTGRARFTVTVKRVKR